MIKSNKVNIMNIKHISIRYFLNNKKNKKGMKVDEIYYRKFSRNKGDY